MAKLKFKDLIASPKFAAVLKAEAQRALKHAAAWEALFPRSEDERQPIEAGIESARTRLAEDDYPPTAFGEWLRARDVLAIAKGRWG